MNEMQFEKVQKLLKTVSEKSAFYKTKYAEADFDIREIKDIDDFNKIPFTDKYELRGAYPLGLQAVSDEEIVRIHSSSGTTGKPVIIPYTKNDVNTWAIMMSRCYEFAGVTSKDRVHITPGYGLWTAGIGFQNGAEHLGAMTIPMGPGNTDKQIQFLIDLQSTVLTATSSYALLLAEEIAKRGIKDQINLKKAVIGSERWGNKMRHRIQEELGVDIYDIYGLTEIYGPGISISCDAHEGLHYWDDYLYFEIIDPSTGKVLPVGEWGELVITTLAKEGAPLIRYRTHDITRLLPGECSCGSKFPRHDLIMGRTDDMTKVKGVNIFPGQIDEVLKDIEGASSEYQVIIDHIDGKDQMILRFEKDPTAIKEKVEFDLKQHFKSKIGITILTEAVPLGELPRSEKKSQRIFDHRYN